MIEFPVFWGCSSLGEHMFVIILGLEQCETEDHGVEGSIPSTPIFSYYPEYKSLKTNT